MVHMPGRRAETYRRALVASRVLHSWTLDSLDNPADSYRVDIVALHPAISDGQIVPGRETLVYRLRHNHQVVLAGDDIEVPAGIDIHADDTLRGLVGMLLEHPPDLLSRAQREWLTRHSDDLRSLVIDIPTPLRGGHPGRGAAA